MHLFQRVKSFVSMGNFIWIGIGTACLYWVLESFIHVLFFGSDQISKELISPDVHELWKRILVISLLILFGVFAQQYFILRQRSENKLKESEKKYRTIFKQASNPIFLFDDEGRLVDSNRAVMSFLECTQEDLPGKSFREITAGKSLKKCMTELSRIEKRQILEIDYPLKERTKTILLNLVPLSRGRKNFVYGIGQDISERKQMELGLKQAHAELNQIFQTASVGMRVVDRECNVLKINETFALLTNVTEAEAVNKKCYEIFRGPMCHTAGCPIRQVVGGVPSFETYVDKIRPDGKAISTILTAKPFYGSDGTVLGIVESFRDISQLKEAHEIIHSERDKLQRILSHLQEGVSILSTDYVIEYQNEAFMENFGNSEGKTCYSVLRGKSSPCSPCLMQQAIQSGNVQNIDYETADGRSYEQVYTRITDVDGQEKTVLLLRDITAKKASMAVAMHAERLAAVGELAAGVAHEINNPINGIINYAQIISNRSEKGDFINDVAIRMVKEGNRIARIVEGLLTFSGRRHEEKMIVSVNDILSESLTLTAGQMRKDNITLKIDLDKNLPQTLVQAHEIEQVFINIISNATYALNQKYPKADSDKVLKITSRSIRINNSYYTQISFLDHGTGIPARIIEQVKNPFFSTKTEGKRTGLGLSISHGIVENHHGQLTIDSKEGLYTNISVDLPIWQEHSYSRKSA